ncbi:MAG: hypothetical protein J6386_12325 [Candidatus Synoicihabitans palmerolidicus]|nr:hypothetical protein [Candidatus Synoicihabitans palmerolidicus]
MEIGLDAAYSTIVTNRGYDVFRGDLLLKANNSLNPFGQNVRVSLYETHDQLGQSYSEAQLDFYSLAGSAAETNIAPTLALKFGLANGLTFRGSFTTSNRFPTPFMSRNLGNGIDAGTGVKYVHISDSLRGEDYDVQQRSVINPDLRN